MSRHGSPRASLTLLGLWGDVAAVHMAVLDEAAGERRRGHPAMPAWTVSVGRSVASAGDPARTRDAGSVRSRAGRASGSAALARPRPMGCGKPAGATSATARADARAGTGFWPPRARACTRSPSVRFMPDHRARAFPLHRQWRDRRAARGTSRLCPQGDRVAHAGCADRAGGTARGADLRRQYCRL